MLGSWDKIYIWGHLLLSFMESSVPTLWYVFSFWYFFHFVHQFLLARFLVWVESLISEMSRSLSTNLYLRPISIAIYGKFNSYCLHPDFFLSGLQVIPLISDHLKFMASVDIEGSVSILSYFFSCFFLLSKLHYHHIFWAIGNVLFEEF